MSQDITCIGSILVADTPEAIAAYNELLEVLDLESYDDVSLTSSDAGLVFDISITEWNTSVRHAAQCRDAIVDFTTEHAIDGAVFKTGPEDGDILCLGSCPVSRREAHVGYLNSRIAYLQGQMEKVKHSSLSDYLFDSEIPTSK